MKKKNKWFSAAQIWEDQFNHWVAMSRQAKVKEDIAAAQERAGYSYEQMQNCFKKAKEDVNPKPLS